jgi:arylsulfatase A-like enzyme
MSPPTIAKGSKHPVSRLDAALGAALVLAYLDVISAYIDDYFSLAGAAAVFALLLVAGGASSLLLVGFDRLHDRMPMLGRKGLQRASLASAAVLTSPLVLVAAKLARQPGLVLVVTVVLALAFGGVVFVASRRIARPWSALAASTISAGLFLYAQQAIYLLGRVSPAHFDLYWLLVVAGVASSIGLACFVERLLAVRRSPLPVRWALVGVATGIVGAVASAHLPPSNYPVIRNVGFIASFLLLMLPFSRQSLPGPASARYVVLALATVGVGFLAVGLTPFHRAYYYFAHTPLGRALVIQTGLFERSTANLIAQSRKLGDGDECLPSTDAPVHSGAPARLVDSERSVLLISIDTLRYDHLGYSGTAAANLTPRIDALARDAQRYHHAYPQGGWTSISLPSLFWSRYAKDIHFVPLYEDVKMRLYLEDEVTPEMSIRKIFQTPLEEPNPNVVEALAGRDIATIAIPNDGMTHYFQPKLGFMRGFETIRYPRALFTERDGIERDGLDIDDDVVTHLAIRELEQLGRQRFFMWLHYFSPHAPYRLRPDIPFEGYESEIAYVDQQVGLVLDTLERLGLDDKTLVVLLSDHGEAFYEHGYPGHGLSLHDPALRIPLLFRLPGLDGRDHDQEIGLIDVAPTILSLLDVPVPTSMSGRSLAARWTGEDTSVPPPVFLETWRYRGATNTRDLDQIGVVHQRRKVILDLKQSAFSFFDLERDPGERTPYLEDDDDRTVEAFGLLVCELARWYGL